MPLIDKNNVVILETDSARRDYLKSIISSWGLIPFTFEKESICLDNLASLSPDLVIAGPLSSKRIFRFINAVKLRHNRLPVIIVSNDKHVHDYIDSNGFGDVVVVETPVDASGIKRTMDKMQHSELDGRYDQDSPLIIGNSPEFKKIKRVINQLGPTNEPVLIQGEAGTGKDLVARAIHHASDRRKHPLIKIDTQELTHDLAENTFDRLSHSNFFENDGKKCDLFELADNGTIFLDEVGTMPAHLQAKLIQVFETEKTVAARSDAKQQVGARIIAGTSLDIKQIVEAGKFRKDLYFRLNVICINIPPLRHRAEDIPLLTNFFNDKFCGQFGKSHYELSDKTMHILQHYHWPGNVKELKDIVKQAVLKSDEKIIIDRLLLSDGQNKPVEFIDCCEDIYILSEISDAKDWLKDISKFSLKDICKKFVAQTEKKLMKKALDKTNWNRKEAALLLDISYKSLLNKIKAYNLT